jgi:hypothetical protein
MGDRTLQNQDSGIENRWGVPIPGKHTNTDTQGFWFESRRASARSSNGRACGESSFPNLYALTTIDTGLTVCECRSRILSILHDRIPKSNSSRPNRRSVQTNAGSSPAKPFGACCRNGRGAGSDQCMRKHRFWNLCELQHRRVAQRADAAGLDPAPLGLWVRLPPRLPGMYPDPGRPGKPTNRPCYGQGFWFESRRALFVRA